MCTAATARRRRKQFQNGFGHLPPLRRPNYKRTSVEKQKRKLAAQIERIKTMQARKK